MGIRETIKQAEAIVVEQDAVLLDLFLIEAEQARAVACRCGCAHCIQFAYLAQRRYERQLDILTYPLGGDK